MIWNHIIRLEAASVRSHPYADAWFGTWRCWTILSLRKASLRGCMLWNVNTEKDIRKTFIASFTRMRDLKHLLGNNSGAIFIASVSDAWFETTQTTSSHISTNRIRFSDAWFETSLTIPKWLPMDRIIASLNGCVIWNDSDSKRAYQSASHP